jgi:hypothetical protein
VRKTQPGRRFIGMPSERGEGDESGDLFCGSDASGQRAACTYTIIETAKMCGINPQAYLANVFNQIADHPIRQIDTLLPWRWAK